MDDIQRCCPSIGKTWLLGAMLLVGSFTAPVQATTAFCNAE